jgi:hypothetical protein
MRKFLVKLILSLTPKREWRQYLQSNFNFFDLDIYRIKTKYGKVYAPIYNKYIHIDDREPQIYNSDGSPIRTFFLRDKHIIAESSQASKYFMFDKYNFELPVHFYTHTTMRQTMGTPRKKYGLMIESESIVPQDYFIFDRNPNLAKEFNAIFTYNDRLLDKLPNAKFLPFAAGIWNEKDLCDDMYQHKTKNVSMLSSRKCFCELHRFRLELAHKLKRENLADTFGTFDGGKYAELKDVLNPYRYTFCLENDVTPYYFSERLTSALAAQTIPLYLGATKIDEFFNPDGIIKISTEDDIEKVLKQCTKEEYERRLPAVLDNYQRALKYLNIWDMMYEKYLKDDLSED